MGSIVDWFRSWAISAESAREVLARARQVDERLSERDAEIRLLKRDFAAEVTALRAELDESLSMNSDERRSANEARQRHHQELEEKDFRIQQLEQQLSLSQEATKDQMLSNEYLRSELSANIAARKAEVAHHETPPQKIGGLLT